MNQPQKQLKILLLGDACIDEYRYGTVERISPEAPVPVFTQTSVVSKNGMAANVDENLKKLGVQVVKIFGNNWSIKTRYIDDRHNHHMIRVDDDKMSDPIELPDYLDYDGIVVSDYNKGAINRGILREIQGRFSGPVFIDTKMTDLWEFQSNNLFFKINQVEHSKLKTIPANLIITLGQNGASYQGVSYPVSSADVLDVCGAGDTFLAAVATHYIQYGDMPSAIKFANKAASITVKHRGIYAPTIEEILCD